MSSSAEKLLQSTVPSDVHTSNNVSSCDSVEPSVTAEHQQHAADVALLNYYSYGVVLPIVCGLGIVGNILNIIVLTRKNMKGVGYCYMRGYAVSSLVAIILAVPFSLRMLAQNKSVTWKYYSTAFYFSRLELFLGNGLIGLSALLLVVLTVERYVSVCHPVRAHNQSKSNSRVWIVLLLMSTTTALFYFPYTLRSYVLECKAADDTTYYYIAEFTMFTHSIHYLVYKWLLKIVYKIAPTIVIAYLNTRIYCSYRQVCRKRFSALHIHRESKLHNQDEHRLMMLLASTATLFFICNLPMVVLSVSFTASLRFSYAFQVFRAVSNILEIFNYSGSFYIYCLFTKEFRDTFLKTIRFREISSQQTSRFSRTEA